MKVDLVSSGVTQSRFHDPEFGPGRGRGLQAGVYGLGLEREHGEYALVYPPQRFTSRGPVQAFEPEGVFAQGQRAFVPEPARA